MTWTDCGGDADEMSVHDDDQVPDGEGGDPKPDNGVRLSGLTLGKRSWECSGRYDMLGNSTVQLE